MPLSAVFQLYHCDQRGPPKSGNW